MKCDSDLTCTSHRNREGSLCIPTICLDSTNDSDSHLDCATNHGQFLEDHSFINNVSHILSCLSYFGPDRKLMVAVALLSQCGPSFAKFAGAVLQNKFWVCSDESTTESFDQDRFSKLNWDSLPPDQLFTELLNVASILTGYGSHDCQLSSKRCSVIMEDTTVRASPSACCRLFHSSAPNLDLSLLKRDYLRLLGEVLIHCEQLKELLDVQKYEAFSEMRESILLSHFGQLLMKTMFCAPFTRDECNELLSVLRTHRDSLHCASSPRELNPSEPMTVDDKLVLIVVDCVLDIMTDLASVAQVIRYGFANAGFSLSHSLTSSGFLSGGSGSQYDLLSEASNGHSLASSQYGTLLTVPSSEGKFVNVSSAHTHWDPKLNQRRVSDSPLFSGSCSLGLNQSDKNADLTHLTSSHDPIAGVNMKLQPPRASLPNTLLSNNRVQTVGVQTGDSSSISGASSTHSSSLDLGVHRTTISPPLSLSNEKPGVLPSSSTDQCNLQPQTVCTSIAGENDAHSSMNVSPQTDVALTPYSVIRSTHGEQSHRTANAHITPKTVGSYADCAMAAVPAWLKSLRLHKYAKLFDSLTFEEFLGVSDSWLQSRNVTQGARSKLLLNIRKLAARALSLSQVESLLSQSDVSGANADHALHHCLSQVWSILQTPIPACSAADRPPPAPVDCTPRPDAGIMPASTRGKNGDFESSRQLSPSEACQEGCLPDRIMACLTKVCSRLLVTSQPEADCCAKFLELLDIIADHPAFLHKHRSLVASWRQQLIFSHLISPPQQSPDMLHDYANFYAHRKPWYKHTSQQQQLLGRPGGVCKKSQKRSSPPFYPHDFRHGSPMDCSERASRQPAVTKPLSPEQRKNTPGGPHYPLIHALDDSALQNYVSANRYCLCSLPARPLQGKRMPSPNPRSTAPFVENSGAFSVCPSLPKTVSEVDTTPPMNLQMPRARMPSASGLDLQFHQRNRSNLAPPATAPPTRMPSPSDLYRYTGLVPFSDLEPSLSQGSNMAIMNPKSDYYTYSTLSIPSSIPDVPAPVYPHRHSGSSDGLVHFHPHPNIGWGQSSARTAFSAYPPAPYIPPGGLPVDSLGPCAAINPVEAQHSIEGLNLPGIHLPPLSLSPSSVPGQSSCFSSPSHWSAVCCGRYDPNNVNRTTESGGLDHIESDLEMLTRNVTELAIGEFDSPSE